MTTLSAKTIGDVAKKTGIHPSSLRRWENLNLIKPERMDIAGRSIRVYSPLMVSTLRRVKELLDKGFTLKAAFQYAAMTCKLDSPSLDPATEN